MDQLLFEDVFECKELVRNAAGGLAPHGWLPVGPQGGTGRLLPCQIERSAIAA